MKIFIHKKLNLTEHSIKLVLILFHLNENNKFFVSVYNTCLMCLSFLKLFTHKS